MAQWLVNSLKNDDYPYYDDTEIADRFVWSVPVPYWIWKLDTEHNDGYPCYYGVKEAGVFEWREPMPSNIWRLNPIYNDGYPYMLAVQDLKCGAFLNCKNLKTVIIPETVTFIGDYAFFGTSVSEITVSEKCIISGAALPDSCIVKHY